MSMTKNEQSPSKEIAKRRLKSVLDAERNGLSHKDMEMIKADLQRVLSSYFDVDESRTVLKIERRRGRDERIDKVLTLSATIKGVKRTGMKI